MISKLKKSAKEVALDCLSRRALSYFELETRLKEKGFESAEVLEALVRMEQLGYLNDSELALAFAKSRLHRYSRRRVQQDLQKRGFQPDVIEEALELTHLSNEEFSQCLHLAQQWWLQEEKHWELKLEKGQINRSGKTKILSRELWLEQKLARRLIQRGYPTDMVRGVLDQLKDLDMSSGDSNL